MPVSVGVGDVYEALQTGALDYSFPNRGNILSNRLYEPGPYSWSGHGDHRSLIVINDVWGDIAAGDQAIILEEGKKAGKAYIDNIEAAEEKAGAEIIKAGGIIKEFPASELAKWKAAAPDLLQNWVDDMTTRGMGDEAGKVAAYGAPGSTRTKCISGGSRTRHVCCETLSRIVSLP